MISGDGNSSQDTPSKALRRLRKQRQKIVSNRS
jgi:hypothetical protein